MKEKVFAQGYCFKKIIIFFIIGCLLGSLYEEILSLIQKGVFEHRDGLLIGPFNPTYGLGTLLFVALLGKKNEQRGIIKTFLIAALVGGLTEYLVSFFAAKWYGIEFWNYKDEFLNINGRTTIPFMIGWGIAGTVLLKLIYPFLSRVIEKIPYIIGNIIYYVLFVFISIDLLFTTTVFIRMTLRDKNIAPLTKIGEYYDKKYNDDYLKKKFPVMKKLNESK